MELEIKVRHCKDVKCFNFFQKLQLYTVVSVTTTNNHPHSEQKQGEGEAIYLSKEERQEQRTPVDNKAEDGDPEWNQTMRFNLPFLNNNNQTSSIKKLFLHFQLRHRGQFFGDKVIGNVYVPFDDLIPHHPESSDRAGIVRFVDYQVKSPEGKPNGVISFSYKVVGIVYDTNQLTNSSVDITGYPLLEANQHQDNNQDQVNQVGDMKPLKIQYPTIDPVPEYTATTNLVSPSVRPPQSATEYNYNDNLYYNYDPYYYTGGESNSVSPHYPPPPGSGPPPPQTPRPRSMWEIPRDFYAPLPHFAPPFPQYGPPPHHHHHRPFRGPRPHGWR